MQPLIITLLLAALLLIWVLHTRRRLSALEENAGHAMYQLGVQLASRRSALTALLELARAWELPESGVSPPEPLPDLTALSTPEEVLTRENAIRQTLTDLTRQAARCPGLTENPGYLRSLDAVNSYGRMLDVSRLIYNDSVDKLNRAVRPLPNRLLAGLLGFHSRDYLGEGMAAVPARSVPAASYFI